MMAHKLKSGFRMIIRHALTPVMVVSLSVPVLSCGEKPSAVTVASLQSSEDADQESWGVLLRITEDGKPRLVLTAGHVLKYERPDSTFMLLQSTDADSFRVRVDIFNADGDSSAVIFADRIYYYEQENRFVAQGEVIVTALAGRSIESEHLIWTEDDRKIRTPGFATIVSPGQTISGYSLEANEDLSEATLARVSGTFISENQQ